MFEWQQMEYTDCFICWQSSSSWWYPKARARTMENTESAFLVSSEVSGSKTFCLAFFKTEFINWSAWARGKRGGGGVERARWCQGSSPSKPQKTTHMLCTFSTKIYVLAEHLWLVWSACIFYVHSVY